MDLYYSWISFVDEDPVILLPHSINHAFFESLDRGHFTLHGSEDGGEEKPLTKFNVVQPSPKAFETAVNLAKNSSTKKLFFESKLGGLFTCDPTENSLAALIRIIGFDEVQQHPQTPLTAPELELAAEHGVSIQLCCPLHQGTIIAPEKHGAKWMASEPELVLWRCPQLPSTTPDLVVSSGDDYVVGLLESQPEPANATRLNAIVLHFSNIPSAEILAALAQIEGTLLGLMQGHGRITVAVTGSSAVAHDLHKILFPPVPCAAYRYGDFGPSYAFLHGSLPPKLVAEVASNTDNVAVLPPVERWWHAARTKLIELAPPSEPLFVYSKAHILEQIRALKGLACITRVFYAMKANFNEDLLRIIESEGLGFECVSKGELDHILTLFPDITPDRILFTPNFAPRSEYEYGFKCGVRVTVDNAYCIHAWHDLFRDKEIMLRCDPGAGQGHHAHVRTGSTSKFGIAREALASVAHTCKTHNIKVVGLHAHSGSGIHDATLWPDHARVLTQIARTHFPTVRVLDLGGGLGHAYKFGSKTVDIGDVQRSVAAVVEELNIKDMELWMEPGRRIVAGCGVLLSRVTQIKRKSHTTYVGVNVGMNNLLRPALYDAHHPIVNLSQLSAPSSFLVNVCGPICESADVLGKHRSFPNSTREGDVVLIDSCGAYARCMASSYNLRPPAREIIFE